MKKRKLVNLLFIFSSFSTLLFAQEGYQQNNITPRTLSDTIKINTLHTSAIGFYYNGEYSKSERFLEDALRLADSVMLKKEIPFIYLKPKQAEIHTDLSEIYLAQKKDSLAFYHLELAITISKEVASFAILSRALINKGLLFENAEEFDKALNNYLQAYKYDTLSHDQNKIGISSSYLGNIYTSLSNYNVALFYYLQAIEIFEKTADNQQLSLLYNNIGIVYEYVEDWNLALDYYNKAIAIDKKLNNKYGLSINYCNLGNVFQAKSNYTEAKKYYEKALSLDIELQDTFGIAVDYGNLAYSYFEIGNIPQALEYNQTALDYFKLGNNKRELSITYSIFGEIFNQQKNFSLALENAQISLDYALSINSMDDIKNAYELFSKIYSSQGDYHNAYVFQNKYYSIKDSLFNLEKVRSIHTMEAQYQIKKKDQEFIKKQNELDITNLLLNRKNAQLIILITLIGISLLSLIMLIRVYIHKKHVNKKLLKTKDEVVEKNEALNQQNHEISAQRDEIVKQKNLLQIKNSFLTDSIEYAEKIQLAVLPPKNTINEYFPNNFIFYAPRNIVSGDFYWVSEQGHLNYLAVGDCTGHGVPGAFMSMLGITFLNEILNSYIITSANDCLNYLRDKVVETLHQSGEIDENKDGLDIGFCVIDKDDRRISYSGAHIPLILVRDKVVIHYKPDPRPIGIYSKQTNFLFSEQRIDYEKEDMLYLFTDGMVDQFGGERFKKFKKSRLLELFAEISDKSIPEQKEIIANTFVDWKGGHDQVDDVLVMGVRL